MPNVSRSFASIAALLLLGACVSATRAVGGPGERLVIASTGDVDTRSLKVPPGHLPPVGQCRVWFPGRPPGKQPASSGCAGIARIAPAGSWILYRPTNDKKVVHARVVDPKRDGVIVVIRVYDASRGTYLRDEVPR